MGFRLKTSKRTKEIFEELGGSTNLKPFALSKIAVSMSLNDNVSIDEYKNDDTNGLELQRSTVTGEYDYRGQMADFPEVCEGWTKFVNGNFVEDLDKKAEIIAEREKESKKPTWQETIESQVYYTALMTDTLVEEE